MNVDFLIVGQGIAGTLLSHKLLQAGKTVMVLDEGCRGKASRVAGAVINPRSGKQWKPAPGADIFLPEALKTYQELALLLQKPLIRQAPLYLFSPLPNETLPYLDQVQAALLAPYFHITGPLHQLPDTWLVDATLLLDSWTAYLQVRNAFREARLDLEQCSFGSGKIQYQDIEAGAIIFCEGAAAARTNALLKKLPFTPNRGEALLLDIPLLPADALYHNQLRLVPRSDGLFWCGSNYTWNVGHLEPDEAWRRQTLIALTAWLKIPFRLEDHIVAERPTTAGQVPLLGAHPANPMVFFLNGLGTRGFSAGPYWAAQLACQLLQPGYDIPATAGYIRPGKWLS